MDKSYLFYLLLKIKLKWYIYYFWIKVVLLFIVVFGIVYTIAVQRWSGFMTIVLVGIVLALYYRVKLFRELIGEDSPHQYGLFRICSVNLFILIFVIYFVFSQELNPFLLLTELKYVPLVGQFGIISASPTLGGLVITLAGTSKIENNKRKELLQVAQKFFSAGVLLIAFIPFIFLVDKIGGIDPNSLDLCNRLSWSRGVCFWFSALFFYGGAYLFSLGIVDFNLALRELYFR